MSKQLLYLVSIIFLTGFAPTENSEGITALVKKLGEANVQKENLSYALTFNLYAGENNKRHVSALSGVMIKMKDYKYSRMGKVESLKSAKYFISVDMEDKVLMLSDNDEKANQGFDFNQLKKYLALCKQYSISRIGENQSKLTLEASAGEISKLDIFYTHNYLVQKIAMTYKGSLSNDANGEARNEPQQLVICFNKTEKIIQDDPRLKISNYCTFKNGEWKASTKYSGFQFINNLIKQ